MRNENEGYAIEAALEAGFVFTNGDGTSFGCTEEAIQKFASFARSELLKEIERLREALRPFAERAAAYGPPNNDDHEPAWWHVDAPTIGDLRRARAALEEKE